jgi:hypothetical protein
VVGPYGTIYADPPRRYITWNDKGRDRCPDGPRHVYETMALPVDHGAAGRELGGARLPAVPLDHGFTPAASAGARGGLGFRYSTVALLSTSSPTMPRHSRERR